MSSSQRIHLVYASQHQVLWNRFMKTKMFRIISPLPWKHNFECQFIVLIKIISSQQILNEIHNILLNTPAWCDKSAIWERGPIISSKITKLSSYKPKCVLKWIINYSIIKKVTSWYHSSSPDILRNQTMVPKN